METRMAMATLFPKTAIEEAMETLEMTMAFSMETVSCKN